MCFLDNAIDKLCFQDSKANVPKIPETPENQSLEEDEPQETSDKETEYDENRTPSKTSKDDDEILTFIVDAPKYMRKLVLFIACLHEEVFPKVGAKQQVNPVQFEQMIAQI